MMPDITMCQGLKVSPNKMCPKRWECYRFMATPSEYRQAYFMDAPFDANTDDNQCEMFWKVEKKK